MNEYYSILIAEKDLNINTDILLILAFNNDVE